MTYLIMRIGTALFTQERYLVSADGIPRTSRSVLLSLEHPLEGVFRQTARHHPQSF